MSEARAAAHAERAADGGPALDLQEGALPDAQSEARETPPQLAESHRVHFYEDDERLCAAVAAFLGDGLAAGDALVVIATEPHWRRFRAQLQADGFDVSRSSAAGQLTFLDASATLAKIMRGPEPDRDLFEAEIGRVVARLATGLSGSARLRAYGEMVDVLWNDGQRAAAMRLEELWNELHGRYSFQLLCAYSTASFLNDPTALDGVCAAHTHVESGSDDGSVGTTTGVHASAFQARYIRRLAREIARRQEVEQARSAAQQRAARLARITGAIADAVSPEQVFEALVDQVAAALEASSAALWIVDRHDQTAKLARSFGYTEATNQRFAAVPLDFTPTIPILDSIRHGQPLWVTSQAELLARYPHLAGSVTAGRSYSVACLPLKAQGDVLGTIGLTFEDEGDTRLADRDFLLVVARYASQALERLRLLEAERRSRAQADSAALRLGLLSHASRVFVETKLDLNSRLQGVVEEIGKWFSSCVGIALLQGDGRLHTSAVYHPMSEGQEALRQISLAAPLRLGEGFSGTVAATGEGLIVPTMDPDEMAARAAPAYRAFLQRFPVYAVVCVPLRVRGQTIGVLTANRTAEGETYTKEDQDLLEELAERAAAAIENSRLYQETLDARIRAEQLYRFAHAVVAAKRVDDVYEAALDAIDAALGVKRAAILTFDEKGVMRFRAWRNLSAPYRSAVEGHSPWSRDERAPQVVLVPDAARDPAMAAYAPLFRREGIGALSFIPLVTGGRFLGKFMLYFDLPHPFAPTEIETAKAIANHLASVIVRFRAVEKLEETVRYNELFAGVLAHDLRTPLGAIMTAAQLVLMRREGQGGVVEAEAKPLSRILSSGKRMAEMIDQLLDFTRARSGGGIAIAPQAADLAELCAQALGEIELTHPDWKIHSECAGDPRGRWDPDRLLQVLSNLLSNAGQHGAREAGITLRLDGTAADRVRVEIHNMGAIPESLLRNLFDPFRSTGHGRSHSRGLGLGLFIVREIVQAHGGSIDVSSTEAAGTSFTIWLPRHSDPLRESDALGWRRA